MIDLRLSQYSKHQGPRLVTDDGMLIVSRELLEKQANPKLVTVDGMTVVLHPDIISFVAVFIIALQFSRESYTELPGATVIFSSALQPTKQPFPILVTDFGMVID